MKDYRTLRVYTITVYAHDDVNQRGHERAQDVLEDIKADIVDILDDTADKIHSRIQHELGDWREEHPLSDLILVRGKVT